MKFGILIILIINSLFCLGQTESKTNDLPDKLTIFYTGLENYSTAPSYVSFIAIDKDTKTIRIICCLAPYLNMYFSKGTANIVNYSELTIEIDSLDSKFPLTTVDTTKCLKNGYDFCSLDEQLYIELSSKFGKTLIQFSNELTRIRIEIEKGNLKRKQRIIFENEMSSIEDSVKAIDKKYKLCVPHFYFNYGISTLSDCIDGSLIIENKLNKFINASP